MNKSITIDYYEYEKVLNIRDDLRRQIVELNKNIANLQKDLRDLKDVGDDILTITKFESKPDRHEFKTKEKIIIANLIYENNSVREKFDNYMNEISNLKEFIVKQDLTIKEKDKEIQQIKTRKFWDRLFNR